MNYRDVTATLLNVARQYEKDVNEAFRYYQSQNFNARMHSNGLNVDARDFIPMVTIMGIKGDTQEERAKDIHAKMDELASAFEDPDRSKRNEYLDLIYYLVDDFGSTFDPASMNMNDPAEVAKLLQSMLIEQTVAVKKLENPEYTQKRYPTPQARTLHDAHDHYRMAVGAGVMGNLEKNGINLHQIGLSLPRALPEQVMDIQHCREEYERILLNQAVAAKGNLPKSAPVDFPILDEFVPCFGMDVADIPAMDPEIKDRLSDYVSLLVEIGQIQKGSKNMLGIKEAGIEDSREALYIDGQPFADFVKKHFPNTKMTDELRCNVLGICMFNGKHRVDVVHAYRDETGEMQYEAKPLRGAVTPEQERLHLQQYSWIRRTLFNWWPFRIETLQEKLDRIVNDPDAEKRLAAVTAEQKTRIEAGIKRQAEKAIQAKLELQRDDARRNAFEKEAKKLDDSTARWDKNSVIGILGQQIAGTWNTNNGPVDGVCRAIHTDLAMTSPSKRYATIAIPLAKMVLYSQLCSDRAANNGEPGEIEKRLGMGDAKTIAESIHNTAVKMAEDPILKNLFQDKVGVLTGKEICPDPVKFEKIMADGGVDRFRMEYMQKLQEMANQKEQQAPDNELEMENQKQQEVQKAPI